MIKIHKKLIRVKAFHDECKQLRKLSNKQVAQITKFNKEIDKGLISFEEVDCLCDSKDFDHVASVDVYGIHQQTVVCKRCGLISLNPRMTELHYKNFYESDKYRDIYESDKSIYNRLYSTKTGQHIYEKIMAVRTQNCNDKVLEIGAGGGWNLVPFIKSGINATGLEYSRNLVNLGEKNGINMIQGGLDNLEGTYDIIILNHVLEHFLNPLDYLLTIKNHISKGGIYYIALPNIMNFSLGQMQNAHVYCFTPRHFKYYLSTIGLRLIDFGCAQKIHMYGIFINDDKILPKNELSKCKKDVYRMLKIFSYKYGLLIPFLKRIRLYNIIRYLKKF